MLHYSSCDVRRHLDALVCLPHGDTLPCHSPRILRQPSATLSAITMPPVQFTSVLPVLDSATDCRSNPIAHRVRRNRQRLPPSLLFPIKASDDAGLMAWWLASKCRLRPPLLKSYTSHVTRDPDQGLGIGLLYAKCTRGHIFSSLVRRRPTQSCSCDSLTTVAQE